MNITVKDLLDAGVHFGHQTKRWNPKTKPFVFDHRHGISIIDLEITYERLQEAYAFLEEKVGGGAKVMFVATKKQAQDVVRETANSLNMPYAVSRWMGGALTNYGTVKTSLDKYRKYLRWESDGTLDKTHKKEAAMIKREMSRMNRNFEGFLDMDGLPDVLLVVDTKKEAIAVAEANKLKIPVIALVDTNSDPTGVQVPIPCNDDSVKSIRIIMETLSEAINNGLARRQVDVPASQPVAAVKPFAGGVDAPAEDDSATVTVNFEETSESGPIPEEDA